MIRRPLIWTRSTGRSKTSHPLKGEGSDNFAYHNPLPRASTTPTLTLDTLETLTPLTPMGAKGIGELPTLAAPVAIANAVMDALAHVGVRHIDTPLTPEKIWQALHGKEA